MAPQTFSEAAAPAAVAISSERTASRVSPLVWIFGITVFLSATLLFMVEPMFARMVLPYLGGSPAVWNTCVVFFQATMLGGYAYAHFITRHVPIRAQVLIHLAVVGVAAVVLPLAIPEGWVPPVDRSPIPSVLILLLATVGAPFFVVSSTAPLLQQWFSRTRDRAAADPYFLYAASNLGSMLALLAYPFVVEPRWSLQEQRIGWAFAYAAFACAMVACAAAAVRWRRADFGGNIPLNGARDGAVSAAITWRRQLRWLTLALVPSSLMLGVTTFLTTDVAAVPLLWIAPLALYLLSFVIGFSSRPLMDQRAAAALTTITMMPVVLTAATGLELPAWLEMPLHLVGFFGFALLLHSLLAADRPDPENLTTYYLWISLGGLVGGVFTTLAAPAMFTGVVEYPLMLLAVCAFRPVFGNEAASKSSYQDVLLPIALGGLLAGLMYGAKAELIGANVLAVGLGFMGAVYAACAKSRFRFTAGVAMMLLAGSLSPSPAAKGRIIHAERTFFGVVRVRAEEGPRHSLFHGNTIHGQQVLTSADRREPLAYFHNAGPIGQVLNALSGRLESGRIGVIGLGAGSLAAYAKPGQQWIFYEIDPAVARIAGSPKFFTYLEDCGSVCQVVLGDGRLSVARATGKFDLLVLDAFSSDAIPVHLLTREALQVYLSRLVDDGVMAFHISNRHLDLRPIIGALAADMGLTTYAQLDSKGNPKIGHTGSSWVVLARTPEPLDAITRDSRWVRTPIGSDVWTDDFSNVVKALLRS